MNVNGSDKTCFQWRRLKETEDKEFFTLISTQIKKCS